LGTLVYSKLLESFFIFLSLLYFYIRNPIFSPILASSSFSRTGQLAHTRKLAGLAVTDARPAEDHRVLSRPDEGGARRSSFLWLRWRSRKRSPAPLRLRRRSCSSGVRLAGLRQEPEPLTEPCQTAPKIFNSGALGRHLNYLPVPVGCTSCFLTTALCARSLTYGS
jgi:hypothetical protein